MQATVSLKRSIDFSTLQALLPTLLSVEACTLDAHSGEFQLQFDAGDGETLQPVSYTHLTLPTIQL